MLAACAEPVGSVVRARRGLGGHGRLRDPARARTSRRSTWPAGTSGPRCTVGSLPSALAYAPGGKDLLVVTQGDDQLHEIDAATHQVLREVGVGVEPDAVAVAPGGRGGKGVALVANLDSNSVTPVDLGTWRAGTPIAVGPEPVAIAVSVATSGAATAFVADYGSNTVTPIDVATLQPGAAIPVGAGPQTIAAAPGEVLVGNFGNRTLTAINPTSLRAGGTIALPLNPTGIAVAPSGATAYVCGSAAVVAVAVVGPDRRRARGASRRGAGNRIERGRLDGVGDPTGGHGDPRHCGDRQGGRPAPRRRPPLRHRHRCRLIPPWVGRRARRSQTL